MGRVKSDHSKDGLKGHALPDVILHVVAQLMSHDDFDFLAGKVLQQGIRHDDATRVSPAHNSGICFACLVAQRPLEDSAYWNLDALRQAVDTLPKILVFDRLEIEEQRQEQYRRKIRHGYDERDESKAGIDPPIGRMSSKQ